MLSDAPDVTSEVDLICRIRQRGSAAIEELHDRYARVAFSLAHRILRDPLLTEEVVQDVFLQAWRDAELYDPDRGSVRAWLLVITRARALDRLRSIRSRDARLAVFRRSDAWRPHVGADPPLDSIERSQQAEVEAVLAVLAPEDRRLMALAFRQGLSHAEIAERPGGSPRNGQDPSAKGFTTGPRGDHGSRGTSVHVAVLAGTFYQRLDDSRPQPYQRRRRG
ncbi:MAG: sigma-70 family RNA polymerase sigma factor [Acidobacteria bacterium]|nr:sigma-70 family RNA polymerase sigma factor [Acidobacteriota bacterium]MCA1651676.1 sigma-70 family RNA polymerase sigma factor [Acidobacteriota bacterium]